MCAAYLKDALLQDWMHAPCWRFMRICEFVTEPGPIFRLDLCTFERRLTLVESTVTMSTATALSPEILAKYQPVIGLEVHVQLLAETKAFCGCVNQYGGEPNTHICPTSPGAAGALPVLNRKAVEFAVLAAKSIHCEIRETSIFARKNYFYPDSPKGYQISQFDKPGGRAWLD